MLTSYKLGLRYDGRVHVDGGLGGVCRVRDAELPSRLLHGARDVKHPGVAVARTLRELGREAAPGHSVSSLILARTAP